jgi:hypothetical protein
MPFHTKIPHVLDRKTNIILLALLEKYEEIMESNELTTLTQGAKILCDNDNCPAHGMFPQDHEEVEGNSEGCHDEPFFLCLLLVAWE